MAIPTSTPIFKFVKTVVSPVNGFTTIPWAISPGYKPVAGHLYFYVEVAYSGGEFVRVNPTDPVIDNNLFLDTNKYTCNIMGDIYYRVVLSDNNVEYFSIPEKIGNGLNRTDLKIVNETMRKKYVQMVKCTGIRGYLLRRKDWGTFCTCYDIDLGNTPSVTCPDCFGAGFVGGYYTGVEFWMEDVTKGGTERRRDGETGVEISHVKKSRCIPYPSIAADDIWVDAYSGDRYKINPESVQEVFVRGVSVIEIVSMEKLPPTDYLYNVPVTTEAVTGTIGWMTGFGMVSYQTDMQSLSAPGVFRTPTPTPVPPGPLMQAAQYIENTFTLGENSTSYQIVRVDSSSTLMLADANTIGHLDQVIGFVSESATAGDQVRVINGGNIVNPAWTLIPGATVYLGATGGITQSPVGLSFVQMLGVAVTATRVLVNIQRGIAQ